jgi:hypothetical protein
VSQYPVTKRPKHWAGWTKLYRWDGAWSWMPPEFGRPDEDGARGYPDLEAARGCLIGSVAGVAVWIALCVAFWTAVLR